MKRPIVIALKVAVVALLVVYICFFHDIGGHGDDLKGKLDQLSSGWKWLVLAQVCIFFSLSLTFVRWQILLGAQGIHYRFRETFALGFIGYFFSQFIPGSTGGDVVKAYYVALDHPERRAAGVTTVFLDRAVGLFLMVTMAAVAMGFNWSKIESNALLSVLVWMVLASLVGGIFGIALFFFEPLRTHPRVRSVLARIPFQALLREIQAAVYVYRFHPGRVLMAVGLSVLSQMSNVFLAYCYVMALGGGVEIASLFFIVPLAQIAMAIPLVPGGLGQMEIAYEVLLLELALYPAGFVIGVVQRLNYYLWGLVGVVPYLRRRDRVTRARQLAARTDQQDPAPEGQDESGRRESGLKDGTSLSVRT